MAQYLVAVHLPDNYDPSLEDKTMERAIEKLNDEMAAAGVRVFVGGQLPVSSTKSLRAMPDGNLIITDGPYLKLR